MSKLADMAMTIQELHDTAAAIDDVANWLIRQFRSPEPAEPEPMPAPTLELVRAVPTEKSRAGHTLLSAASSGHWLHCPPSSRLCELYEETGSNYVAEGTDAHTLCEYKLRKALGIEATAPTENLPWFNQEMNDCAAGYAAYILELLEAAKETCADPVVLIEQRVDFSRWAEDGFGTSDAILIADGIMHMIDYKYGLGILISAVENSQMKCYGLGALELFDGIYDIDAVSMTIYQPRRQNISTFEISKDDLYRWAEEVLKPTAELAFAGNGNFLCGECCGWKLLGKARFDELLTAYIEKPQGKPALVPKSDKCPAMNTAKNDCMEENIDE